MNIKKNSPIQYGPNIKGITTLLRDYGYISVSRLQQIISSITKNKIRMSTGSIINYSNDLGEAVAKLLPKIKTALTSGAVMHCDETSVRINGEIYWIHNYSNGKITFYQLHKSRGEHAILDAKILENYEGILISDHFAMYIKYGSQRGECNVHILRHLYAVTENQKRKWAEEMSTFLLRIKKEKTKLLLQEINKFEEKRIEEIKKEYDEILLFFLAL